MHYFMHFPARHFIIGLPKLHFLNFLVITRQILDLYLFMVAIIFIVPMVGVKELFPF